MLRDKIGLRSAKVKNMVEQGWVKKFAEAIGNADSIFVDEQAAATTVHTKRIAPVTFPVTFDYGDIPELGLPKNGLIHGEQTYRYRRPLYVGETVYCYQELKHYEEKVGRSGKMGFAVFAKCVEDEHGELICETEQVIIINEAVRKEMSR